MTVADEGGHNYTSYVNVIYATVTFDNIKIVSEEDTVPDAPLSCKADLSEAHAFKLDIKASWFQCLKWNLEVHFLDMRKMHIIVHYVIIDYSS